MKYAAFLRGINVGGNNMINMAELRDALSSAGFKNVQTYIQSGNVIFDSSESDTLKLAALVASVIKKSFGLTVTVVVYSRKDLRKIVDALPEGWGTRDDWKYNYLFLIPPFDIERILDDIGELKPDIETLTTGEGILYQTISFKKFGQARTGKLASMPIYKYMTVRNHNTVPKLLALMEQD